MTESRIRVLIIDDDPIHAKIIEEALQQAGFTTELTRVETEAEYLAHLTPTLDIVLCDYNLAEFNAIRALSLLRERSAGLPFVIVSGSSGEEIAVEAMKCGATDYLLKSRLERLGSAVSHALEDRKHREAERQAREALRASEEQYRALAESIPQIVLMAAPDGAIEYLNQRAVEYTGRGKEELAGWAWGAVVHPDDLPRALERWGEAIRTGEPREFEFRVRRADGEYRWHIGRQVAIRGETGTVVRWFGTCTDIEDYKRAEEALRFQHALLHCQAEASPDGILVVGPDNRILSYNRRLLELWDIPPSLAEAGDDAPLFALARTRTADPEGFAARVAAIYADPDTKTHDEVVLADGRILDRYSGPVLGATGELLGRVWYFRDVSDRKQAEESLRVTRERLQHVIASSPAILYKLTIEADRIRGLAWVSENVWGLLGYRPDEIIDSSWWPDNIHPEDRERVMLATGQGLIATGRATSEYRFRHRNGQYRWIRSEMRLVLDATGESVVAIGSWSDVTERRQIEEQYRQAQKMEAFGQLSGGVAHDFNNLLTIINGYSDLLLDELPETNSQRALVAEIREAGGRAATLTAQLLAFSRRTIVEPKLLDVNEVVNQIGKLLGRLIGADITLTINSDLAVHRVKADQSQFEQVVMNLAVNARDAMPKGGRLTIETKNREIRADDPLLSPDQLPGLFVQISVADTGTGMTDQVKAKLFEPFFTTKGVGKGTGLGLATAYGIVKQAGGQIVCSSVVGVGTTFSVLLPAVVDTPSRPATGGLAPPKRGNETILLVEDEQALRKFAKRVLEAQGYNVVEASNGADAIRITEHTGTIHLLLTDVVMPGMGGRELAKSIRVCRPAARVLFMSGYTDDADVRHGVVEAMDGFIQKPFTPLGLTRRVRSVLDEPA